MTAQSEGARRSHEAATTAADELEAPELELEDVEALDQAPEVVGKLPQGAPVPLFNRTQIAAVLGVKLGAIALFEAETPPLPVYRRGGPRTPSLYRVAEVLAWRLDRERAFLRGGTLSRELEQARLAAAQRTRLELDVAERRGELFSAGPIREAWTVALTSFRAALLALPRALAEDACRRAGQGPAAVEDLIRRGMEDALELLAAWRPPTGSKSAPGGPGNGLQAASRAEDDE